MQRLTKRVQKQKQKEFESNHTTPDPITMNMYLNEMVKSKIDYCFMEVSSHGIHQKRINGLKFTGGIFTNLTHKFKYFLVIIKYLVQCLCFIYFNKHKKKR